MERNFRIGEISIAMSCREVKNVHLAVHPPHGRVTLVAPIGTRLDVARAYAASRLGWIRAQQAKLRAQAREAPRQYVSRESHYLWGRRHLLEVLERDGKPGVVASHRKIILTVRPGSSAGQRARVFLDWQKSLMHVAVRALIGKWEGVLGVTVASYKLQRMKTRWGSCNPERRTLRLNSELAKKPKDLLEYVIVHEMIHFFESTHSERFIALLTAHYPSWREARKELNELPISL